MGAAPSCRRRISAATCSRSLAGLLYTGYLILVERTRSDARADALAVPRQPVRRGHAAPRRAGSGETVFPADWTALVRAGLVQPGHRAGLLVYALGHVPPLVVGIAMLTQPALSALARLALLWRSFTPLDWGGAAAIVVALVLVRLRTPAASDQ